ncbi:MAG: PP2C family protein-serine/threonine phosphatase [Caldilineales bacterium]|nr:PP2C family protein-serine/threonine phosphatase [Caldilineales bacterium]
MESNVFARIRGSLIEQHQNLTHWLTITPPRKRAVRLGPIGEEAVHAHLQVLDTAIAKAADQTLGECQVCHLTIEPDRLAMDYTCCVCLDHYSPAEREQLEAELEMTTKVQQALLPQHAPTIAGLDLAAYSRPADIVSGDYFDFFQFQDAAHGLVIGDVAGHGMSASLLMASLQASLRTLVADHTAPAEVVRRLNLLFCHTIHLTKFVTLFVGRFDAQRRTLTYCNAGHNPPLLFRGKANGHAPFTWLRPTGAAIGLVEEFQFRAAQVELKPGDALLLYTDGVTEAINAQAEEFGEARLLDLLGETATWPAQEMARALRQRLGEFTRGQPPADDLTFVACKITH